MSASQVASERLVELRDGIEKRKRRQKRVRVLASLVVLGTIAACGAMCVSILGTAARGSDSKYTGWGVAPLGDVDGDGAPDFALRSRFDPKSGDDAPTAWIISGKSATPLYALLLEPLCIADVGDFDRDGGSDYCVGIAADYPSMASGAVRMLSGRTGALIWEMRGEAPGQRVGHSLANVGDIDGDGTTDVLIGVSEDSDRVHAASVELRSGVDARSIARIEGPRVERGKSRNGESLLEARFGHGLCALGDVDGDATPDFAVGSPLGYDYSTDSFRAVGAVFAFSGRTRRLLWSQTGREWGSLGTVLWSCGDRDGDGRTDLVASEYGQSAKTLSGADGGVIEVLEDWRELVPLGDLNGDGEEDAIARLHGRYDSAALLSGRAREPRFTIGVADSFHSFATRDAFCATGDLDGDGTRDFVAVSDRALDGEGFEWTADFGLATLHSGRDGAVLRQISRDALRDAAKAGTPIVRSHVRD